MGGTKWGCNDDEGSCIPQTSAICDLLRPECQASSLTFSLVPSPLHISVTTTIVQRKGAGLSTSSAAAWNEATDFNVTVLWENQALTCVVVVFALA